MRDSKIFLGKIHTSTWLYSIWDTQDQRERSKDRVFYFLIMNHPFTSHTGSDSFVRSKINKWTISTCI